MERKQDNPTVPGSVTNGAALRRAKAAPKSNRLVQWFGADCAVASFVGAQARGCVWAGVPFVGGCSALAHIDVRSGIAGDLHRHLINLARVVREPSLKDALVERLDATLFHPDELTAAQDRCRQREAMFSRPGGGLFAEKSYGLDDAPNVAWAADYFICSWMGRGGRSGVRGEFDQGLSFRWNANGGDSCKRFRSTVESLDAWSEILRPWNFVVMDAFAFLETAQDEPGHFLYLDPPWPDDGKGYVHTFTEQQQRDVAKLAGRFTRARVVVRYGDHPLIRELYPASAWNVVEATSRAQSNGDVRELLIINGPSVGGAA